MEEKDDRQELLDRFMRETHEDPSGSFFTEDELVELFDYANDYDNDFVRMEVLMMGASRYPDSTRLRVRRAFQYYYQGVDVGLVRRVLAHVPEGDVLADILRLRLDEPGKDEAQTRLSEIASRVERFEDEQIIQLVDAAGDLGCHTWLLDNRQMLTAKCSYKPTFLYELAEVLYEAGDFAGAISALEELTDTEPFNTGFWNRLTEAAGMEGDYERALQSADFSLAIDPENPHSRYLKARVLFALQREPDEIVKLIGDTAVESAISLGVTTPAQLLASTHSWLRQDNESALKLLAKINDALPGDRAIVDALLQLMAPDVDERVRRYGLHHPEMACSDWLEWGMSLAAGEHPGDPRAVALVLEAYFGSHLDEPGADRMFQYLYMTGQYDKVVDYGNRYEARARERELPVAPLIVLSRVMGLLRRRGTGNIVDAIEVIRHALEDHRPVSSMDEMIHVKGFRDTLFSILEFLSRHPNPRRSTLDRIDPFPTSRNTTPKSGDA